MDSLTQPDIYLVTQYQADVELFKPILHLCTGQSKPQSYTSLSDIRALPSHKPAVVVCFVESQRQLIKLPAWCQTRHVRCLQICRFETNHHYMLSALSHGFNGVVEHSAEPDLLLKALKSLIKGESWFPRRVIEDALFNYMSASIATHVTIRDTALQFDLTSREQEVLELILSGKNNAAIASTLHLSVHTVKCHVRNVFRKMGVQSRSEAQSAMALSAQQRLN